MNLIEYNRFILGKEKSPTESKSTKVLTTIEKFKELHNYMNTSADYMSRLEVTEDYAQFFEWCPLLDLLVDDNEKEDLFYSTKLGYFIEGVPSKLVYILKKALSTYPPNKVIELIDKRILNNFIKGGAIKSNHTISDIMSSITNSPVSLFEDLKYITVNNGVYEAYVRDVDKVVILDTSIGEKLMKEPMQAEQLCFKKGIGVCLGEVPLKSIINHDNFRGEFDLRSV